MAGKKTSAEQAREQAEEATLGSMLDGAFGAMDGIEGPPEPTSDSLVEAPGPSDPPSGPPTEAAPGPTGPPTGPPSGPPSAPPTETPAPSGPPG
ncbi:MAG: hypothetical protein ISR08_06660, partial [Candidatus Poseidoniaceae archaeon]|nr:hypothetical protein [Candidatus Poseidoniaceae archaeon]